MESDMGSSIMMIILELALRVLKAVASVMLTYSVAKVALKDSLKRLIMKLTKFCVPFAPLDVLHAQLKMSVKAVPSDSSSMEKNVWKSVLSLAQSVKMLIRVYAQSAIRDTCWRIQCAQPTQIAPIVQVVLEDSSFQTSFATHATFQTLKGVSTVMTPIQANALTAHKDSIWKKMSVKPVLQNVQFAKEKTSVTKLHLDSF